MDSAYPVSQDHDIQLHGAIQKPAHFHAGKREKGIGPTAWPRLKGWMSRKAKTLLLSKSLNEGISPIQR